VPLEHKRRHPCDQGRGIKPAHKRLRLTDKIIRELRAVNGDAQITTT